MGNDSSPSSGVTENLTRVNYTKDWDSVTVQRVTTTSIILVLSFFGNISIITVLTCIKRKVLNYRVNIFILNLAIGDLTVCFVTMPIEILFVVFDNAWIFGDAACRISVYLQITTLASTTFILVSMSFDRYMAICHPLSLSNTTQRAKIMVICSWILAFLFASPQLVIFVRKKSGIYPDGEIKYRCVSEGYTAHWQRLLYFTFLTSYILVLPAFFITFCYVSVVKTVWHQGHSNFFRKNSSHVAAITRAKVKTIKMTLCIIFSFIACWTPYFVVHQIRIWSNYNYKVKESITTFAETMALLNSAVNPFLYGFFNVKFGKNCMKRGYFQPLTQSKPSNTHEMQTVVYSRK